MGGSQVGNSIWRVNWWERVSEYVCVSVCVGGGSQAGNSIWRVNFERIDVRSSEPEARNPESET